MAAGREARPTLRQSVHFQDTSFQFISELVESVGSGLLWSPLPIRYRTAWHAGCMVTGVSALHSIFPIDHPAGVKVPAVAIFSFVPAGGSVRRRNHCRKAVRKLSEAMRVILTAEGDGRAVLLADFSGTAMASASVVTCLDLADANAKEARKALGMSEAAFVVSTSDETSLEDARAQAAWMVAHAAGAGTRRGLRITAGAGVAWPRHCGGRAAHRSSGLRCSWDREPDCKSSTRDRAGLSRRAVVFAA